MFLKLEHLIDVRLVFNLVCELLAELILPVLCLGDEVAEDRLTEVRPDSFIAALTLLRLQLLGEFRPFIKGTFVLGADCC